MGNDRCDYGCGHNDCNNNCDCNYNNCRHDCCCDNNNGGGLSILWILIILYLLFCNNDNGRGGLFGLF